MQAELLREEWGSALTRLFGRASENILISSPYVTQRGVDLLLDNLSSSFIDEGRVQVMANLLPQNIIQGATDPESLQHLNKEVPNTVIHHLPRLHAKVCVADTQQAIVTSGNLTAGGLEENYEYGVSTDDENAISVIRGDLEEFAGLGVQVGENELEAYVKAAREAQSAFQKKQDSAQESAHREFEKALTEAEDELLRLRLRGESINATFAKTILYLLRRKGPMSTSEVHPHIQQIHPDLCDDSIHRVIDGEDYGKRWKHRVRSAQSTLKQRGEIEREDGEWKIST